MDFRAIIPQTCMLEDETDYKQYSVTASEQQLHGEH